MKKFDDSILADSVTSHAPIIVNTSGRLIEFPQCTLCAKLPYLVRNKY